MLMEEKTGKENPNLNIVSVFPPDAVHVAKRKWQSFSHWFLWVDDARVNLVQLRELRNNTSFYSNLCEKTLLCGARNRHKQDVDSILQISEGVVTDAIQCSHIVVPEKYRITQMITKKEYLRALLVLQWVQQQQQQQQQLYLYPT